MEVARPPTIDASLWAAWKKKDKNLLLLLLEARVEQLRDYKSGSPTYRVGKAKLEEVLRMCENLMQAEQGQSSSSDASPAQDAAKQGTLTLPTKNLGLGTATGEGGCEGDEQVNLKRSTKRWYLSDLAEIAVEVHLWLASAAFAHACSVSSDASSRHVSSSSCDMHVSSSSYDTHVSSSSYDTHVSSSSYDTRL